MRNHLRLVIGLLLSALGIWAVARNANWEQVVAAAAGVNPAWFLVTIVLIVVAVWLRASRWRRLLDSASPIGVSRLFGIMMIGYLINTVLPARLGEPARAVILADTEGVPAAKGISTIVVERLLDVLTVLVALAVVSLAMDLPGWLTTSALLLGTGSVVSFFLLILAGYRRAWLLNRIARLETRFSPRRVQFVMRQMDNLLAGTDCLRQPRNLVMILMHSALIWLSSVFQSLSVFLAFGLELVWTAPTLTVVANALGMVVPSSPGYIGVFHAITVAVLELFTVPTNLALSVAIVLHMVSFLPLSLFGLYYLGRYSLSFAGVSGRAAKIGT